MKLRYTETDCTNPFINLATEEYMTFRAAEGEVTMYLWQNANTVVIGKNQNPWRECRVESMREGDCKLARRISGGGAVYHDLGNLNFTFIAREGEYDIPKQTEVILEAVRLLGINAEKTGRNDLTIDGMKFSGHAYYQSNGYCYHHGTIMFNVDPTPLGEYLNVSASKLKSKGVKSVRSRITNLINHKPDVTLEELKKALYDAFAKVYGGEVERFDIPTAESDPELKALIDKYSSEEWRFGRKIPFTTSVSERLDWGGVDIELQVEGGVIKDCGIFSDSLETEVFGVLKDKLIGCKYSKSAMTTLVESALPYAPNSKEYQICCDIINLIAEGIM